MIFTFLTNMLIAAFKRDYITACRNLSDFPYRKARVSGTGKVIIVSTIELINDKPVVDGSFAVARTIGIQFTFN